MCPLNYRFFVQIFGPRWMPLRVYAHWPKVFRRRTCGLFTIYIKNPSGFKLCKWNATISIGKSRSEHALSISRTIGKNRKYIVKGLELDGKPSKMWMEWNKPVEKSQPVKEDNLFKHTGFSGNFPIGSTKNMCSIYFLSGITGIFMSMVNNRGSRTLPSDFKIKRLWYVF